MLLYLFVHLGINERFRKIVSVFNEQIVFVVLYQSHSLVVEVFGGLSFSDWNQIVTMVTLFLKTNEYCYMGRLTTYSFKYDLERSKRSLCSQSPSV